MSANKPKVFFTNLKETVGFINKRVNEVTSAHSEIPVNENCEVYQELDSRFNDIKELKKDTLKLKKELEAKQDYFGNFLHDFQDLVLEIEEKVGWHEKYLQKFGYEPLKIEPAAQKEELKITLPENSKYLKEDKTPSISDYLDVKQMNYFEKSAETKKINERESSGGTPHLCFDEVFEHCNKSPELPTMADYSLKTDNANLDCFGDYKKIARKLDF